MTVSAKPSHPIPWQTISFSWTDYICAIQFQKSATAQCMICHNHTILYKDVKATDLSIPYLSWNSGVSWRNSKPRCVAKSSLNMGLKSSCTCTNIKTPHTQWLCCVKISQESSPKSGRTESSRPGPGVCNFNSTVPKTLKMSCDLNNKY
jgi:hypothetical protein